MKYNQWTLALAAAGVVSLAPAVQAEEAQHQVLTALSSTTLSGYVDTSAIWKFGTDRGGSVLPGRSYDGADKQDGFNLNVVKLSLEKPLEEGNWSAGYKVDLLFGPDANVYNTASSPLGLNESDFAVKQAYVNLRVPVGNGLDLKMGVWDTVIGYEVFEAGNNPNYSRSYGFFIEPKTHTGVLASYRLNDVIGLSAGVADADAVGHGHTSNINSRANIESLKSYLGSITITAPESAGFLKGSTLYAGIVDSAATQPVMTDVVNYYVGATVPTPLTGLALGAAYDYRGNGKNGTAWSSAWADAVSVYASFQATEKLKLNLRGEYAWASAGTFTTFKTQDHGEKFLGVTATADYSLWANVISRLEFRWDHDASGGIPAFGGYGTGTDYEVMSYSSDCGQVSGPVSRLPDGNEQRNALSLALNVIYKF